ncbi:MAG: hypothetical protein IID49_15650 [Proteobacteria bacterium]|nr:hypothetical protein [Pseudomonadota bacterium]
MYDNQLRGSLIGLEHASVLLKGNPLGDPHVRTFPVYLPPGYDDGRHHYPVIYALAGFNYAEADLLRRAMTTDRSAEEMEKIRETFLAGCRAQGDVSSEVAERVWKALSSFAAYGFCKAHAVAFARTAYQTAWLKRYFPAEFLCAVLDNQPMGFYSAHTIIQDALRLGIKDHFSYGGNRSDSSLQVTIEIRLGRDAKFLAKPRRLRASGGNAAARDALFQAGRRALLKAQNAGEFNKLPAAKYAGWKLIHVTFTPEEIGFPS